MGLRCILLVPPRLLEQFFVEAPWVRWDRSGSRLIIVDLLEKLANVKFGLPRLFLISSELYAVFICQFCVPELLLEFGHLALCPKLLLKSLDIGVIDLAVVNHGASGCAFHFRILISQLI